jgi:iron complex outermembrane receptor protein
MSLPRRRALALACAIASLLTSASAASAQDSSAAGDSSATSLDTITVTTDHGERNLLEVPVSVGVVQGERLRECTAGGDDTLLALSGKVPSFYAKTTTGRIFPRFYIRGLGHIDFYLGASQPVSIIQDDVVLEHVVLKSNPI